jgi:arylsulfatase A-like enzyme
MIKHTLTLLITLLVTPLTSLRADETATARPNILHIHTDDQRPDGLHALGTPLLQTPNLDTLVERGMTFTHCYTMGSMVGAVCAPSRAMLLTGRSWLRIPRGSAAAANAADPSTFLPRVMAAAGYQTWHMGKAGEINAFGTGLKHFEIHIPDNPHGKSPADDRAHSSQRLADKAIDFLKSRDASGEKRPFYAYLAPPVPHDPRSAELRFHKLYDPEKVPLSPAFMPQHPFDNGDMTVRDEKLAPWPRTPENTKQQLADYYACITGFDYHIGRIFEQLKQSGQWDNTIIIFSSDNGLSMGEHGLFGKQNLYEFGGMHVPLVVAGPGIAKGKSEAFVYLMDLFPTFAEFAGAKIPDGVEGKSIVPLLTGKQTKVRDVLYTAYRDCQRAIRDDRWKLIRYPLVDRTQLFDLSNDPHELVNLADKPEHAAKIAELTALLTKEMARYADTTPLKVANPKPAEWTPPVSGTKPTKKAENKNVSAPAPAAAGQPTGKIRKDSNLHFTNWDTNKDDFVTLEEFKLGQKNRNGLEKTFKSYDKNGDGKLSREEYVDPRAK